MLGESCVGCVMISLRFRNFIQPIFWVGIGNNVALANENIVIKIYYTAIA